MAAKSADFGMLGYSYLFASRDNPMEESLETQGTMEMPEAYAKLYELDKDKKRDLPYWKRPLLLEVCSKSIKNSSQFKVTLGFVDHLFSFCESRKAFTNYRRTLFIENMKPSLCSLAIFDAIITKYVHSLQNNLIAKNSSNTSLVETQVGRAQKDIQLKQHNHRTYSRIGKEMTIPHESAIHSKPWAPLAAFDLLQSCLKGFKEKSGLLSTQLSYELSVQANESEAKRLDYQTRYCTIALEKPSNGKFYIALMTHFFKILFVAGSKLATTVVCFKVGHLTTLLRFLIHMK